MFRHLLATAALALGAATAHAGAKAAIFPVELDDVSIEGEVSGPRPDETRRLALVTDELRKLAASDAGYEVMDLAGLAPDIAQAAPLYKCNGCDAELARRAGADVAITSVVRKVSGLILQMFVFVRDAQRGTITKTYQVDIKGNTDETWLRGMRWLAVHGLSGRER